MPEKNPNNLKKILTSILLTLPCLTMSLFAAMEGFSQEKINLIAMIITIIYFNVFFFLIVYTGKIDKYRSILFISVALAFPLGFTMSLWEKRGHFMVLTFSDMVNQKGEFCPIGVTQIMAPLFLKGENIFPASTVTILTPVIISVFLAIGVGRSWCSWGCFWGGWDSFTSRIMKKPLLKKINEKFTYIPFAIFISTAMVSLFTFSAVYCFWICPFKTISEFVEPTTLLTIIQMIIFLLIFLILVIVLPLISKKRSQCIFLCPFGAFISLFSKLNPFKVAIDRTKCNECKKCVRDCPMMAINEKTLAKGETKITCSRCGKCIDNCPQHAIYFNIKGTKIGLNANIKKMIFLYSIFFITLYFGAQFIQQFIYRILLFITSGSFLH
jgi:ferredoxin-type protein NapH